MKYAKCLMASTTIAIVLTISGCGGSATSNSAYSNNAGNKSNNAASPAANASPAGAAPAAKQGTPPKADITMTAADLYKDYKTLGEKDPKSIADKYENKKIQISGTISRVYPTTSGLGTSTDVSFKGATSNDDYASCHVLPETEESQALKVGDVVTMVGTQTNNYNGTIPRLEKCFVVKVGQ